jgi:2-polyprenyl-3-methyl-5-hydroxy-6-metoxy-1,4-benzoquinol methylase
MDTDKFIIEMKRILKPDGLLFLTTPNIAALKNRLRLLFGKYPYNLEYKLGGAGHVHIYNKTKLKEQLEEHGLKVIRFYGINIIPWSLCQRSKIIYKLNSLMSDHIASLCLNMAVICKKQ